MGGNRIHFVHLLRNSPVYSCDDWVRRMEGQTEEFDREMYWTAFVFSGAVAGLIFVYTQRNGGTWPPLMRVACFEIAALLFGVALGFGVGILTRRSSSLPE
jgi:ABC-type Fe3+-siderophore transport system permease subunit